MGRLGRMHADQMEEIETRRAPATSSPCSASTAPAATPSPAASASRLSSMHVPEPVVSLAVMPEDNKAAGQHDQGPAPLHPRGSHLPHHGGRRDRRHHHQRHGRAAPRGLHRAHQARVRRRGHHRRAPGEVPRDHDPGRWTSTTPTRSRPVVRASTPRSRASSSPATTASSTSRTRWSAATSPPSTSAPARRASQHVHGRGQLHRRTRCRA